MTIKLHETPSIAAIESTVSVQPYVGTTKSYFATIVAKSGVPGIVPERITSARSRRYCRRQQKQVSLSPKTLQFSNVNRSAISSTCLNLSRLFSATNAANCPGLSPNDLAALLHPDDRKAAGLDCSTQRTNLTGLSCRRIQFNPTLKRRCAVS